MFRKILVPVDIAETEMARPAIDQACEFASQSGGEVRLLYVRSLMPISFAEFIPPNFDEEQQTQAETEMKAIAAGVALPRDRVSALVRIGAVYPEVLAEAKDWNADLVIVGSHRPSMASYLLGSNASTIVRHAPCSVLVVRSPAKA